MGMGPKGIGGLDADGEGERGDDEGGAPHVGTVRPSVVRAAMAWARASSTVSK